MALEDGIEHLMQQTKKFQAKMQALQEEVATAVVVGESGAGRVKVSMNGRHDVTQVDIAPELLQGSTPEDKTLLEELIAGAVNDAVRRVEKHQSEKMSELTGGMTLPPGFKLPFS